MIRAKVNILGTVSKEAVVRTDKNHKSYLSFILTVKLPDAKINEKEVNIFVAMYTGQQSDIAILTVGKQITVTGEMDIHKKDDFSFYMNAEKYEEQEQASLSPITGTLVFRGRLKNDHVYEEKKDKNGNSYLIFSAYSAEKHEDKFYSTWVNFMRFPATGASIETIIPDFMKPKTCINVIGELTLSSYNGVIHLSSLVKEISEYQKPEYHP